MKIEVTPQVKRFNAAIEQGDKRTSFQFDWCEPITLAWVLGEIGDRELSREIRESIRGLENGGKP